MSVLYLSTSPKPLIAGTDAVFQEIMTLRDSVGGESISLTPLANPGARYPRSLFGFHALLNIRAAEKRTRIIHIHYPELYRFPVLRFLNNPLVYSVTASLNPGKRPDNLDYFKGIRRILVSNERDAATLRSWGCENHTLIHPGIDAAPKPWPVPSTDGDFCLLMASAPWVENQFAQKGVDALLEVVTRMARLKLILVWRGLLADRLEARLAALNIRERVSVINEHTDIYTHMQKAHAAILVSTRGNIVKAWPHSLLEALAANRPVIISDTIPMADYVRANHCGVVVKNVSADTLAQAIETLVTNYPDFAASAAKADISAFSHHRMIEEHRRVYFGANAA